MITHGRVGVLATPQGVMTLPAGSVFPWLHDAHAQLHSSVSRIRSEHPAIPPMHITMMTALLLTLNSLVLSVTRGG